MLGVLSSSLSGEQKRGGQKQAQRAWGGGWQGGRVGRGDPLAGEDEIQVVAVCTDAGRRIGAAFGESVEGVRAGRQDAGDVERAGERFGGGPLPAEVFKSDDVDKRLAATGDGCDAGDVDPCVLVKRKGDGPGRVTFSDEIVVAGAGVPCRGRIEFAGDGETLARGLKGRFLGGASCSSAPGVVHRRGDRTIQQARQIGPHLVLVRRGWIGRIGAVNLGKGRNDARLAEKCDRIGAGGDGGDGAGENDNQPGKSNVHGKSPEK